MSPIPEENEIIKKFSEIYYRYGVSQHHTFWMGIRVIKSPTDLWIYHELVCEIKPDVIIETGTFMGGCAFFLAHICDLIDKGRIITVDNEKKSSPVHKRITYLIGSSITPEIIQQIKNLIHPNETVMAILDSNHNREHVLEEMKLYGELVTPGSYLIVEDTNSLGGSQAAHAVTEFCDLCNSGQINLSFKVDKTREKYLLTWNPNGYLKKNENLSFKSS